MISSREIEGLATLRAGAATAIAVWAAVISVVIVFSFRATLGVECLKNLVFLISSIYGCHSSWHDAQDMVR
jgi:hypothetical protein